MRDGRMDNEAFCDDGGAPAGVRMPPWPGIRSSMFFEGSQALRLTIPLRRLGIGMSSEKRIERQSGHVLPLPCEVKVNIMS